MSNGFIELISTSPAKQNMLTDQVIGHIDGRFNGAVEKLFVSLALHIRVPR